jgi:hypothetical protein
MADILSDYIRQSRPEEEVYAGPQIDPELIRSAAALQQQTSPTMALSSRNQPAANAANNAELFPEISWTSKKEKADSARLQAEILKNQELTKFAAYPEHVYKAYDKAYTSLLNQKYPETEDFVKANPQVYSLGTEIKELVTKRNTHISKLATYVNQADEAVMRRANETDEEYRKRIVPLLESQLKIYNTALVGTSDALSNQERKDLAPQLPTKWFDLERYRRTGGGDLFKGDLANFKNQVAELHDLLLNEVNDAYNILAVQSSPRYANKQLGTSQYYFLTEDPNDNKRRIPRITENDPAEAISGLKPLAQVLFQRKEEFNKDVDKAYIAIKEGRSEKQVRESFLKEYGTPLPSR